MLILVAIRCPRFGFVCDTCHVVLTVLYVTFVLVMLKDVTVASKASVKTSTESEMSDESAGERGMKRLQYIHV